MPSLLMTHPRGVRRQHPIDVPVVRVGTTAECDIQLPAEEGPGLVLLVEHDTARGGYVVHNKSPQAVWLAGMPLRPGAKRAWEPGQDLGVGSTTLRLDDTPASRRPPGKSTPAPPGRPAPAESKGPRGDRRLVVIGLCGAALALLVAYSLMRQEPAAGAREELEAWVRYSERNHPPGIAEALTEARAAEARGQTAVARAAYQRVRGFLLSGGTAGTGMSPEDRRLLAFVARRLGNLPSADVAAAEEPSRH